MPLYEYRCERCGEVFEVLQRFSDAPLSVHEKCGGAVQKLLSASALQFKGSGFYVNDYAKAGRNSAREGKGGSEKGGEASKSDSSSTSSDGSSTGKSEPSVSGKPDSHSSTTPTSTPSSDTK